VPLKYEQSIQENTENEQLSIPRLELIAVLMATKLLTNTRLALNLKEEKPAVIYSDSKCVLHWPNTVRTLPTFVNNRVREIHTIKNIEFRHVKGKENIADLPTRTCTAKELQENTQWWAGPNWIQKPEEYWPQIWNEEEMKSEIDSKEEKQIIDKIAMPIIKTKKSSPFDIEIRKYNSYDKLIRITAICIQFLNKISKGKLQSMTNESAYTQAKFLWIKSVQKNKLQDVMTNLQQVKRKSSKQVRELQLFIDERQIIRCKGRFYNVKIGLAAKYPIFLPKPKQNRFVFLLVTSIHKN